SIHAADIAEVFDQLRSRRVCVLLDVSFAGFRTRERVAQPHLEAAFREFVSVQDEGVTERMRPGRVVLTTDSLSGSPVLEKHGLLADVILKCFYHEGKKPITTADLATALAKRLKDRRPLPLILDAETPPFPLRVPPGYKASVPEALPPEEATRFAKKVLEGCT